MASRPNEAAERLARWGRNELRRAEPRSAALIFAEQMTSLPIALLAASAALSLATGGVADAVMIAAVVLVNAGIAATTERQADRSILALAAEAAQQATVIRNGTRQIVDSRDLTPGDILLIERGMLISADARLIDCDDLTVNESPLTGEVQPARKNAQTVLPPDTGVSDRRNMVFRGTAVTGGSGAAIVTAVGARTQIGRVQALLGTVRPPETPIQRELGDVGRELVIVNGLICASVFGLGHVARPWLDPHAAQRDFACGRRHSGRIARRRDDDAGARRAGHAQAQGAGAQDRRGRNAGRRRSRRAR